MSQADNDEATLVLKLPLGNPEGEALATQDGKPELPAPNSQAGAWELEELTEALRELNGLMQALGAGDQAQAQNELLAEVLGLGNEVNG